MERQKDVTDAGSVRSRIKRVIVDSLMLEGLAPEAIGDDQALFDEGLGLDSVDALELVLGLESEFAIKVKGDALEREAFASVNALAAMVERQLVERDLFNAAGEGAAPRPARN